MTTLTVLAMAFAALTTVILTIPFGLSALNYRQRDNGLAFLLLVSGVAVWNGMLFNQLLTSDPMGQVFFLALSVVGAVLAALGFFLFATTASSTPDYLSRRSLFAVVGILGGLDIVFAVTAPVHQFYWDRVAADTAAAHFAVVSPGPGYWFHTALLVGLFGAGAWLFLQAAVDGRRDAYPKRYAVLGTATVLAILVGNVMTPGGFSVAAVFAGALASIGWLQASRGRPLSWMRAIAG